MAGLIVVAPDHAEIRRLEAMLKEAGRTAWRLDGMSAALRILGQEPVDGIFCALNLDDGSPRELLRQLEESGIAPPPLVVVGDFAESRRAAEVLAAGAVDFLPMPVDPAEVGAAAARLFAQTKPKKTDTEAIRFEARGGVLILFFPEEVPFESARRFNKLLERGLPPPERGAVLDLSRTRYLSSTAVSSLFLLARRFPSLEGRLAVTGAPPRIRHALDLAGASEFYTFAENLDAALGDL